MLGNDLVCGYKNHVVLDGQIGANRVDVETLLVVHEDDLWREQVHEPLSGGFKRVVSIELEH